MLTSILLPHSSSISRPPRVKICGLTRPVDVQVAVQAGADAVGFVFFAPSPRAVSASHVATLLPFVPPFVQAVGLFVDVAEAELVEILAIAHLDLLQFHGHETPEQCQHLGQVTGKRWIKALQVKPDSDVAGLIARFKAAGASGVLLDAWHPSLHGGTGQAFDWHLFPASDDFALILAGGLTADNVAEAIRQTHPYAVDVSGGVEESKGVKSAEMIKRFIQHAKSVA